MWLFQVVVCVLLVHHLTLLKRIVIIFYVLMMVLHVQMNQDNSPGWCRWYLTNKGNTVRECHKNALKSSSIAHVYTIYICVLMNASQKKSGISIHLSPVGFFPCWGTKIVFVLMSFQFVSRSLVGPPVALPVFKPGKGGSHPRNWRRKGKHEREGTWRF